MLVLTRALAPLWVIFIAAAFVGLGPATPIKTLFRNRHVQVWLGVCAVAASFSLVWDLVANPFQTEPGSPLPPGSTGADIFVLALDRLNLLVTSSIGQFGWLDAPSPAGVIVTWLGALGAVVIVGACLARRRGVAVIVGTVLAWALVPTVIVLGVARKDGIVGQGRDYMGLAVGIPIVAAFVAGERFVDRRTSLRLTTVVIALLAGCQVLAFYGALRRYTVGTGGPLTRSPRCPAAGMRPCPGLHCSWCSR